METGALLLGRVFLVVVWLIVVLFALCVVFCLLCVGFFGLFWALLSVLVLFYFFFNYFFLNLKVINSNHSQVRTKALELSSASQH